MGEPRSYTSKGTMISSVLLQAGAAWGSLLMPLVFLAIFYFILIVPQQRQRRQHRALLESLAIRDRVTTLGGLIGDIVALNEDTVTLKTGDARVLVERAKIARRISPQAS